MSSHHIVRDDQEPALIIANGAACSDELLGQLLEWSPLVVVLDSAMERVVELGIKVDVLLGDFDRGFDANYYRESHYPIEIIHTPDQDKTDLEKAFDYLYARNIPAVNVVWATGKRADHTITNLTNIVNYREKLKIVIIDDHSKVFLLPRKFEKWYTEKTPISLIPVGKVTTYSDIADQIGNPNAVRAVATAIGKNPICLLIPCHRVIRKSGGMGGYRWGLNIKNNLLISEL